jgi:hypothetical protein
MCASAARIGMPAIGVETLRIFAKRLKKLANLKEQQILRVFVTQFDVLLEQRRKWTRTSTF